MYLARLMFVAALACASSGAQARKQSEPGRFDYYAVALSWSPSYCATRNDPDQCAVGRRHGFVLHGLWPQHERGFPESCSTEKLPPQVRERYGSLFPSQAGRA